MSSPAGQPAPRRAAAPQARTAPGQAAPGQAAPGQAAPGQATQAPAAPGQAAQPGAPQGQAQPGAAQGPQPQQRSRLAGLTSSTPRMLRLARGAAAAAALLTGVVATGTFSTEGVNATPNVIAQQWVAAERAGVEMAHADLLAAQRVDGTAGEGTQAAFDEAVGSVTRDLAGVGSTSARSADATDAAQDWASFVVGAERAAGGADAGGDAAAEIYAPASQAARSATTATDALATEHATDLHSGSRAGLIAVVGLLTTTLLLAILVWLALRTRRIVNVPLAVAAVITAGLTYVSLDPSALPVDYEQRVQDASASATALQDVYQARQAQHAVVLGLEDRWAAEAGAARDSLADLRLDELDDAWDRLAATPEGDGADVHEQAISASQEDFETIVQTLQQRLDDQLAASTTTVGRPAAITSGVAFLLGLIAAALAWAGISQRLKDYR